ncbi:unnamed protein product [Prorocentrum cordatum]|uniref:Uncharacterized protein n=2 Tax=Prorocentrum cordatum TaxID=2364126 RepID=A0ABN9TPR0_9DINO|nr:unnamed protein product [Polarella glacialis]
MPARGIGEVSDGGRLGWHIPGGKRLSLQAKLCGVAFPPGGRQGPAGREPGPQIAKAPPPHEPRGAAGAPEEMRAAARTHVGRNADGKEGEEEEEEEEGDRKEEDKTLLCAAARQHRQAQQAESRRISLPQSSWLHPRPPEGSRLGCGTQILRAASHCEECECRLPVSLLRLHKEPQPVDFGYFGIQEPRGREGPSTLPTFVSWVRPGQTQFSVTGRVRPSSGSRLINR